MEYVTMNDEQSGIVDVVGITTVCVMKGKIITYNYSWHSVAVLVVFNLSALPLYPSQKEPQRVSTAEWNVNRRFPMRMGTRERNPNLSLELDCYAQRNTTFYVDPRCHLTAADIAYLRLKK